MSLKLKKIISKQNAQKFPLPRYNCNFEVLLIHASKWKGGVYKVSEIVIYGWSVFATSILRRVIFHFIFKIALKCLADCTKLLNVQLKASSISNL